MARPDNGWGEPSFSQDIADNYMKTHHKDENGEIVANDEEYLNSLYDDEELEDFFDSVSFDDDWEY